jgi:hypothetical protein
MEAMRMKYMTKLKQLIPIAAVLALILGLSYTSFSSHATNLTSPTLHGDAAHPAKTANWVDTQLYFGLGPADDATKGVSEADWRGFLDKEVTPRFPAGLSVVDVYGQWQGKEEKAPERIRSKMLVILYPKTAENTASIEAIRTAWKQKTGDQSVLKVTQPADVSF